MAIFETTEPALQVNSITTAAKLIFQITGTDNAGTVIPAAFANSSNVTVVNTGKVTVFLGSSSVTASTGLPLAAGSSITLVGPVIAIYGITSAGTTTTSGALATFPSIV